MRALAVWLVLAGVAQASHPVCFVQKQQVVAAVNPYYYSVQPNYAPPFVASSDVDAILKAAGEVERLRQGLTGIQIQGLQASTLQQQQLQAIKIQPLCPPENQPITQPAQAQDDSLDSKVHAILAQNKCFSCHGNGQGGLSLSEQSFLSLKKADRALIYMEVNSGRMPKGGQPLSDESVQVIADWASQGKR